MYFTICITFLTLKSPKFIFYKYTDISKLISSMYHIPVFLIALGVVLEVLLGVLHVQGAQEAVQEVVPLEITRVATPCNPTRTGCYSCCGNCQGCSTDVTETGKYYCKYWYQT